MKVESVKFEITNFDNAAMVDDRSGEVARMLRAMADKVFDLGVVHAFDETYLRDSNGNPVGFCSCIWEEEDQYDGL